MTKPSVGFLGLGAMGLPMAKHLIQNGYPLHITCNRSRSPVDALVTLGATEHSSAEEVAKHSTFIVTILPTDKEMEEVLLAPSFIQSLTPGTTLIEMTSGSPSVMKRIAEAYLASGIQVLDTPVSGGTVGAEKGKLTVMAAGDPSTLDHCQSLLSCFAATIHYVGSIGAGKGIKAINQMMAAVHMLAVSEATVLAEQLDIEPHILREVIMSSSGASWMLENKLEALLEENYMPGFKLSLMRKDIQIAVGEGKALDLPLSNFALALYQQAESTYGNLDFAAISHYLSERGT